MGYEVAILSVIYAAVFNLKNKLRSDLFVFCEQVIHKIATKITDPLLANSVPIRIP